MLEEFKCKIEKLKGYFLLRGNPDLTIWIDLEVQQGFSVFSSPNRWARADAVAYNEHAFGFTWKPDPNIHNPQLLRALMAWLALAAHAVL